MCLAHFSFQKLNLCGLLAEATTFWTGISSVLAALQLSMYKVFFSFAIHSASVQNFRYWFHPIMMLLLSLVMLGVVRMLRFCEKLWALFKNHIHIYMHKPLLNSSFQFLANFQLFQPCETFCCWWWSYDRIVLNVYLTAYLFLYHIPNCLLCVESSLFWTFHDHFYVKV